MKKLIFISILIAAFATKSFAHCPIPQWCPSAPLHQTLCLGEQIEEIVFPSVIAKTLIITWWTDGTRIYSFEVPPEGITVSGASTPLGEREYAFPVSIKGRPTDPGTHHYTVSNTCGVELLHGSITLGPPAPTTPGTITFSNNPVCQGGAFTASIAAVSGATTYNWTTPASMTDDGSDGTTIDITNAGTTAGSLAISVTASNACGTSSPSTASITVHSAFTAGTIASTGQTLCSGSTAYTAIGSTTAASGGAGSIEYQWLNGGTAIASSNSATYTPTAAGTYTRQARNTGTGACQTAWVTSTGSWVVSFHSAFTAGTIASTGQTLCSGASNYTAIGSTTAASGGAGSIEYQWLNGGTAIASSNSATYTPTAAGTYTRQARNTGTGACQTAWVTSSGSWVVSFSAAFTPGAIATTGQTLCAGSTAFTQIGNATAPSGGAGTIEYQWKHNGSVIGSSNSATWTPTSTTGAGTYTREVRQTGTGACQTSWIASTGSWVVSFHNAFTAGAIATTGQTLCAGSTAFTQIGNATAPSGGAGTIEYQWKHNGTVIGSSNSATWTPTTATGAGTYTREVRQTGTGACQTSWVASTGSWVVTLHPAFVAGAIATTGQTLCAGSTAFTQIGNATAPSGGSGTIEYQWKHNGTVIGSSNSATWTPTSTTDAGTYTREVRQTGTGACQTTWVQSTGSWVVSFHDAFTAGTIASTGQTLTDEGQAFTTIGSTTAASGGAPNIEYQWLLNGTTVLASSNNATHTPTQAGTYTRQARNIGTGACQTAWETSSGSWVVVVYPPAPQGCNFVTASRNNVTITSADFATNRTWPVGDQIWSDAVISDQCAPRGNSYNGGTSPSFNVDCRAPTNGFNGHYFSWCAVMKFADILCPGDWRVPTTAEFLELHLTLGHAAPATQTGSVSIIADTYMGIIGTGGTGGVTENHGGTWGGSRFAAYANGLAGADSYYWSSSEYSAVAAFFLYYSASIASPQSTFMNKIIGNALRCVRDN
ncbi:MAG: hypothetical protein FWG79_06600 [Bacteroidales bacterium]|nr:hypothetical protein [Bacteroidales bacterium]